MKKSRYDVIWDALKKDRDSKTPVGVKVTAIPQLHARIIKAVQKRKDIDLTYKYVKAEQGFPKVTLISESKGSIITFKLVYNKLLEGL